MDYPIIKIILFYMDLRDKNKSFVKINISNILTKGIKLIILSKGMNEL